MKKNAPPPSGAAPRLAAPGAPLDFEQVLTGPRTYSPAPWRTVSCRYPTGVRCARCQSAKVYKVSRAWKWQCKQCNKQGYRFSPLVGTLFENTKYPLTIWFKVIYLLCQSKKGMSALQIHRMIGSGSYPPRPCCAQVGEC